MVKVQCFLCLIRWGLALNVGKRFDSSLRSLYDGVETSFPNAFVALLLAVNPAFDLQTRSSYSNLVSPRIAVDWTTRSTNYLRYRPTPYAWALHDEIATDMEEDELPPGSDSIRNISGLRRIEVRADLSKNTSAFAELGISVPGVLDNLKELGIVDANALQRASFDLVKDGNDVIIHAWTGSGKTLAFFLPLIENLMNRSNLPQALILCASREVAHQIGRVANQVLQGTALRSLVITGGTNGNRQREVLKKTKPQIIIGTPGRVLELATMKSKSEGKFKPILGLRRVRHLVIDEVDEAVRPPHSNHTVALLDELMFRDRPLQKIFASATADTLPVRRVATQMMKSPVLLRLQAPLGNKNSGQDDVPEMPSSIFHSVMPVQTHMGKTMQAIRAIYNLEVQPKILVFANTPERVRQVAKHLQEQHKIPAKCLLGDQERENRVNVMHDFLADRLRIVITTEMGARGLDIPGLTHVINLDFPTDAQHYVHRAGRCGRAGVEGVVINLVPPGQEFVIRKITEKLGVELHDVHTRFGELRLGRGRDTTAQERGENRANERGSYAADEEKMKAKKAEKKARRKEREEKEKLEAKLEARKRRREKGKQKRNSKPKIAVSKTGYPRALSIARHGE